jgi:hypothetical protein
MSQAGALMDASLEGTVYANAVGEWRTVTGATVTISEGLNAGRTATTGVEGSYRFDNLFQGPGRLSAVSPSHLEESRTVTLRRGTNYSNFLFRFQRTGRGNSLVMVPENTPYVSIVALYGGLSAPFVVRMGDSVVVNETLRISLGRPTYERSHSVVAREVAIRTLDSVAWWITENRASK